MSFKSLDEIVSQINFYINQLNNGKLAAAEIDVLLNEVNQLQERLIILRYKAFENTVKELIPSTTASEYEAPVFNFSSKNNLPPADNQESLIAAPSILAEVQEPKSEKADKQETLVAAQGILPEVQEPKSEKNDAKPIQKEENSISVNQISLIDAIQEVEMEKGGETDARLSNFISNLKKNSAGKPLQEIKPTAPVLTQSPSVIKDEESPSVSTGQVDLERLKINQNEAPALNKVDTHSPSYAKISTAGSNSEMPLAEKLQKQPIANLNKAIGLNQRFLFINELFKQNADDFQASLDRLNAFEEYEEASVFLKEQIIPLYKWDIESKTVAEFMDLLERRFM